MKIYKFTITTAGIDNTVTPAYLKAKMLGSRYDFGVQNLMQYGVYKLQGYVYDFRDTLKVYIYKQHGSWHEVYALNKTNVRHLVGGKIDKIIEL